MTLMRSVRVCSWTHDNGRLIALVGCLKESGHEIEGKSNSVRQEFVSIGA